MVDERLTPLPPLHALRAFDAAARFGRFRDAAQALGLSESAVSHQIRRLEEHLGVALFERTGNSVTLSPAGRSYFAQIDPAFARIRAATADLMGPVDRSRVLLTLLGTLATFWLIPKLGDLEARHPEISLQLVTTGRLCDLKREQIHLGIRYGHEPWSGLVAERLLDEQAFPVCAPGFLTPELKADPALALRRSRLIVNDTDPTEWANWAAAHGVEAPSMKRAIVLHQSDQALSGAIERLGLAIGRRPLVDRYLEEGVLEAPFGSGDYSGAAYFLIYPDDVELTVAARKVARWLHDIAAAQPHALRGG